MRLHASLRLFWSFCGQFESEQGERRCQRPCHDLLRSCEKDERRRGPESHNVFLPSSLSLHTISQRCRDATVKIGKKHWPLLMRTMRMSRKWALWLFISAASYYLGAEEVAAAFAEENHKGEVRPRPLWTSRVWISSPCITWEARENRFAASR